MPKSLLRTDREIREAYERNADTVYRVCFTYMKNPSDTEDMVQNTFLKLISYNKPFLNYEHEKAWLIVTAGNICKDFLKSKWSKRENISDYENSLLLYDNFDIDETLIAVMALPDKYKTSIYLYYYEGFSCKEIAGIMHRPKATIRVYLHKGRQILKERLGGDFDEK